MLVAGIVGLWFDTRTVEFPLGPAAGEIEAISIVGIVYRLAEQALVGFLLVWLRNTEQEG